MILIINSAGYLPNVEALYTGKNKSEIDEINERLFEQISYYLPLPTGIIVAHLRQAGFPVIHCDQHRQVTPYLSRQLSKNDFVQWLINHRKTPFMEEYLSRAFKTLPSRMEDIQLIGISVRSFVHYTYTLALAKELNIRYPNIPICLGGSYITLSKFNFPGYISYIVKGNGGEPVCHLADHILNKSPFKQNVPGLYKIRDTRAPDSEKNQEPADNEELPDYSDLNLKDYLTRAWDSRFFKGEDRPRDPYLLFTYRTSLGCSNKCSFCSGRKVDSLRFKSKEKVINDLKTLSDRYSQENLYVMFLDNSINSSESYIKEVFDGIIEKKITMKWISYAKMHNMTPELLETFARSGCKVLFWGIEAVTPRMLKVYNKRFQMEEAKKCLQKAVDLNIYNVISVIFNGPNETEEDFQELLKFIVELSRFKSLAAPNLNSFTLEENSDIFNNPGEFNIEVFQQDHDPYSQLMPFYEWKEIGSDIEELKKVRENRQEIIQKVVTQFWS